MDQSRGILFLADPMNGDSALQKKIPTANTMTLIFDENGRYLSLAQAALWRMRQEYEWICVAAEGSAACIAVALAAQLPVDRLALAGSSLFTRKKLPRELKRLERYARHNLALVASEILLIGAGEEEMRGMIRGRAFGRTCTLDAAGNPWVSCRELLAAPWTEAAQNSLINPWKCV